jgi:uncharacterized protein Yka (UPF0111/DUF47 family)
MKPDEIKKGLNKYLDLVIKSYESYKRAWSNEIDKPTEDGIESITNALAYINQLEAKVERLNNECRETRRDLLNEIIRLEDQLETAKSEAVKEFAERLKGTFPQDDFLRSTKRISEDIDNLKKRNGR